MLVTTHFKHCLRKIFLKYDLHNNFCEYIIVSRENSAILSLQKRTYFFFINTLFQYHYHKYQLHIHHYQLYIILNNIIQLENANYFLYLYNMTIYYMYDTTRCNMLPCSLSDRCALIPGGHRRIAVSNIQYFTHQATQIKITNRTLEGNSWPAAQPFIMLPKLFFFIKVVFHFTMRTALVILCLTKSSTLYC